MRGYCISKTTFTRDNIYHFEKGKLYSYNNNSSVEIQDESNPDIYIGVGFSKQTFEYYFETLTKDQVRDYRLNGILELELE